MIIQVNPGDGSNFLSTFAKKVGTTVKNSRVIIPAKYGTGYVLGYVFEKELRMIVRNYVLDEDLTIKRAANGFAGNLIVIAFRNILNSPDNKSAGKKRALPSVTISTQGLEPEVYIAGKTHFNAIHLAVEVSWLKAMLPPLKENTVLKNIIENKQPLVFEHIVTPKLQQVAAEITGASIPDPLQRFFYKIKAEELICYLLVELLQRQETNLQSLNMADIEMLYAVRDKLVHDLSCAPSLNELSLYAGMSQSKLKRLFKQVFGNSIFNYFQKIRMEEAANLLKQEKLSVSEVGYRLGFSNLGHFTRVFEQHMLMKPKRFSLS